MSSDITYCMQKRGLRYCPTCSTKLQKRGLTAAGAQRWFCPNCKSSATRPRPDPRQGWLLDRFVEWLMGRQTQAELGMPERTWRDQTAWCWDIAPVPPLTGEVHPVILLDGIRVGSMVCLIARTPQHVVLWHWAPYEAGTTWDRLLVQLPAPVVAVCDGQKGILLAIARSWPRARVQRCHFHVWQNVRTKLTMHPQTGGRAGASAARQGAAQGPDDHGSGRPVALPTGGLGTGVRQSPHGTDLRRESRTWPAEVALRPRTPQVRLPATRAAAQGRPVVCLHGQGPATTDRTTGSENNEPRRGRH